MQYYSTQNSSYKVSFAEAVKKGLPSDNGLFMPERIDPLPQSFFNALSEMTLPEIGFQVARHFINGEIPDTDLKDIVQDVLNFDIPVVEVEPNVYSLELFHGPTLAFKDVGARFMARCLEYFLENSVKKTTVLVATSGDTGSAVANGFLGVKGVDVGILYPKGKISLFQEKQMTTLGQNIKAFEVDGTFDDCQKLVKTAFLDNDLTSELGLTSANSINIARLIPQSFYYFYAYAQLNTKKPVVFSVPSGNYGNLTAGILAKKLGLPISHFVVASNANDIIPKYLQTAIYKTKPSVKTISNAMDVGDPSNYTRLKDLFGGDIEKFRDYLTGFSYTDDETKKAMISIKDSTGYIADPHGAVGYLGLKDYMADNDVTGVFLETAHPIKFKEVVEPTLNTTLDIPESLRKFLKGEKKATSISGDYAGFKKALKESLNS